MDTFTEQIIKARPSAKQRMLLVGAIFVIIVSLFILMFINGSIGLSVMVLGIVLYVCAGNAQHYEYEYEITNGDCDIARITNQTSRKNVYSFVEGDVKRIMSVDSDKYRNERQINSNTVVNNFTSRDPKYKEDFYAFFVTHNGEEEIVLLELKERALEQLKGKYKLIFEK